MSLKVQDPDLLSRGDDESIQLQGLNVDSIKQILADEETRRKGFERSGMYVEAEMSRSRIIELRETEFKLNYEHTLMMHQQRQEEMNTKHMSDYKKFNHEQDLKLQ